MKISISSFSELSVTTLYQILKLRVDVFVVEQNCPYPEIDGKDPLALHFYLQEKDEVFGYLRIYYPFVDKAIIGRLICHSKYRGRGIGKLLMERAMQFLNDTEEIKLVQIQAQSHLCKFYAGFGFKSISEEYLEDGIPHVDMDCRLKHQVSSHTINP